MFFFFIVQFFQGKKMNPALISPPFLSLGFSLLSLLFLFIFRANQNYFQSFFEPETKSLMTSQSTFIILLVILGPFFFYLLRRARRKIIISLLFYLLFGAGIFFSIYLRYSFPLPSRHQKLSYLKAKEIEKRVILIELEGLSFDFIIPLVNKGKLPNFSWFMERGSWGRLKNFTPSDPFILNASFETAKLPAKHRQISSVRYRLLNFKSEIEVTPRFILFNLLTRTGLVKIKTSNPISKSKDIWSILSENKATYLKNDSLFPQVPEEPNPRVEKAFKTFYEDLLEEKDPLLNILRNSFSSDCEQEDLIFKRKIQEQPQLTYFHLHGLNLVEKFFYKYSFPELFGNVDQEKINRYGSVISRYYEFYDQIIGKYLAALRENELLVIFSTHGIEPLPLWKRVIEWFFGNPEVSGYHEYAPDGVIFFYGKEIVEGNHIEKIDLIDLVPTLLNYLSLPVGRDMDGVVISSIFNDEFKTENPVLYISSYEEIVIR